MTVRRQTPVGFVVLLFAALLFRAAIPAGWMPNLERAGGAPIVICTGAGDEVVRLPHTGAPAKPHSGDRHDLCAFSGIGAAPVGVAFAVAQPARLALAAEILPAADVAAQPPARHREQAARAPPTLV